MAVMQATNEAASLPSLSTLSPEATTVELTSAVISDALSQLLACEPGLRSHCGEREVHRARVEIQRLRGRLRALRPVLDKAWVDRLDGELGWLAHELGALREVDVHIRRLGDRVRALPPVDIPAGTQLVEALAMERAERSTAVRADLDSSRFGDLVGLLWAATSAPLTRPFPAASCPARTVLPVLIEKRWRRVCRAVEASDAADWSDDALHRVRKAAKKLRYASEMAIPIVGPACKGLTKAAESVQDVLGEGHDAATTQMWLRRRVLDSGSSAAAVAAGELIGREHERGRSCRAQWPKTWRKARRKKLRKCFR